MARLVELENPWPSTEIPGLMVVGFVELRPGEWVYLYDSPPAEGKQSINTPEGWNALAERMRQ